jgi:hypothetical protein
MKISLYIIYLEMQPNALLLRQKFIIRKKRVLQGLLSGRRLWKLIPRVVCPVH